MYGGTQIGTESLTWVLLAVTKLVLALKKTRLEEPQVPLGTPEPYAPDGSGR